jgi:hypothetical protein
VALESRGGYLQPYRPGFWAVDYDPSAALWNRQGYIDPRTGKVWESLEEALKYANIEASIPDIRSSDIWRGPPVEGSVRTPTGRIESVIPVDYPPSEVTVSGIPGVSSGVPVQRDDISNWRVNQEYELRKAIEREEIEPQFQSIDTSMLSRLIPSAQASDLAPLPPPPTSEELWKDRIDRGVALQELLKLEEAPSGLTPLRQPQIGPTQLEQPQIEPSLLEPPSIPVSLEVTEGDDGWSIYSRGEKVSGPFYSEVEAKDISAALDDMLGDASIFEYKKFGKLLKYQEPKKTPFLREGGLLDSKEKELNEKDETGLLGVIMSEAKADDTVRTPSFSSEVHDLYAALSDAEHRSSDHRKNRWVYADVPGADENKAWGPVQMKPDILEEAKRVGSLSSGIPLTAEEESYVDSFLEGHRYVGKRDKELYISIAKKLLHYYSNKYKDPLRIANVWRWGERGSAPRTKYFGKDADGKRMYGLEKDISNPKSLGSDPDYWKEFKRMMGL